MLIVYEPRHEQLFAFAATTDGPQPDSVLKVLPRPQARNRAMEIHTGEFILTAKPADHVLVGRVVYEADGKPAASSRHP